MSKYQVLIILNIALLVLFYVSGTLASATFNPFEWNEDTRIVVSIFYLSFTFLFNAIVITEYNPK